MRHVPAAAENDALNALRAGAAIVVMCGHLRIVLFRDYDDVPHTALNFLLFGATSLGHQAVVVFFVLSGFWVGGGVLRSIPDHTFSWKAYFISRGVRLWVVLVPALMLTAAVDFVGRNWLSPNSAYEGSADYHGVVQRSAAWGMEDFLGNSIFLQTIVVPPFGTNTALWSLAYEFWFYMLFPILVYIVAGRRLRTWYIPLAIGVCLIMGIEMLSYFPIWCLGALVAYHRIPLTTWIERMSPTSLRWARAMIFLTLGSTAVIARGATNFPILITDMVVALVAAVMLIFLLPDGNRSGKLSSLRLISGYAKNSYSLYCIHLPLVILTVALLGIDVDTRLTSSITHWLLYVAICFTILVAAVPFARLTERNTARVRGALITRAGRPTQ